MVWTGKEELRHSFMFVRKIFVTTGPFGRVLFYRFGIFSDG